MRIVCIYTKDILASTQLGVRCVASGKKFGYNIELFPSVSWTGLDEVHKKLNLTPKYTPVFNTAQHTSTTCPAVRMANGTTHFMLYKWAVENNKPICILEHDAMFVGLIPEPKVDGVVQISSHINGQANEQIWRGCTRAIKMEKFQPTAKFIWDANAKGVVQHPLTGTSGTSGYIIHPGAAKRMVDYIERDGIANADRIRTEWVGEGNLYLQIPQSVICDHKVRTAQLKLYTR